MKYTALVLAARRPGENNPLAEAEGVSHKCLIDIGGESMIARVADCLARSPRIGHIMVSIDDPSVLDDIPVVERLRAEGRLSIVFSAENFFASVAGALGPGVIWPALITTADNALMTPEMIGHFIREYEAEGGDVAVAVTSAETIWAKYPDGQRRPHRFADGKYSNCNIFALKDAAALHAAKAFEGGGQFGKSKLRVLQAFGFLNLLIYISQLYPLAAVFQRISRRFGLKVIPVELPFAEAPIDVDHERSARLARQIIAARAAEETGAAAKLSESA